MLHHERVKPPTQDYPPDEWNLVEIHYRPEFAAQMETVLALGNGYLGMRGVPEEGGPSLQNGTMLNVTDSKIIRLFVDDEPFWLPHAHLLRYDRRLNMKAGTLDREILWETH